MKIIDANGRFFGIINVIDLLVLLVVAAMLASVYLGYKNTRSDWEGYRKKIFTINAHFSDLLPEIANAVRVGDEKPGYMKITDISRKQDTLDVTFRAFCVVNGGRVYLADKPIRVRLGDRIYFNTETYKISGLVTGFEECE